MIKPWMFIPTEAAIAYDLKATFTAANQTFTDGQVLNTAAKGVEAGSLTVVDTSTGSVKLVDDELEITGDNVWWRNSGVFGASIAKSLGKAILQTVHASGILSSRYGLNSAAALPDSPNLYYIIQSATVLAAKSSSGVQHDIATIATTETYKILFLLGGYNSIGVAYKTGDTAENFLYGDSIFIKGGSFTTWTLLDKGLTGNTGFLYLNYNNLTSSQSIKFKNILTPTPALDVATMFQPNFLDTFTDADGPLSTHVPDVVDSVDGTVPVWESGADTWSIQSNAAVNDPGLEASLWDADATVFTSGTYSWVAKGSNTISNDANTLKITRVDNNAGADILLRDADDLSSDLTVGKIYKQSQDAKVGAGDSVTLYLDDGPGLISQLCTETSFTTFSKIFSAKSAAGVKLEFNMPVDSIIWIDNLSLQEITLNELFATKAYTIADGMFDLPVTLPTTADGMAGIVNCLDSKTTPANFIQSYYNRGTGKVEVWKCVAGTYTNLINTTATYSAGAQLRVILDYNSTADSLKLKVYYNGALIGTEQTITDAGIAGNTRHGIMSTSSANSLDNFTVSPRTNSAWDAEISSATDSIY